MAENQPSTLSAEELAALAHRLADHADDITNQAAQSMSQDMRAAARFILAHIDDRPTNIAPETLAPVRDEVEQILRRLDRLVGRE